jgi:hypothetical protein
MAVLSSKLRLGSDRDAAEIVKCSPDCIRAWRTGRRRPEGKTPLIRGYHWDHYGRLVRLDLDRFEQWLTESREVHQIRINEFLAGSCATPIEGVRGPGRPRREGSAR